MSPLTPQQVLALAPDDASAKAAQGLVKPAKWVTLGAFEGGLWGECQGSGKTPYLTYVDLGNTAFKCSCPSRKFPCKHGLGLYLLYAQHPKGFDTPAQLPPDLQQWLQKRQAKTETKNEKEHKPVDEAARQKRQEARHQKVEQGIAALQVWLKDLVRGGIAQVPQQMPGLALGMAARMVDAQAPGLAWQLRRLSDLNYFEDGWQLNFLRSISGLYMATLLHGQKSAAAAKQAADSNLYVGYPVAKEEVLQQPAMADNWLVLAKNTSIEDNLTAETTWLYGLQHKKFAQHLQFLVRNQVPEVLLTTGTILQAELVFYPGTYPLRALFKSGTQQVNLQPQFTEHMGMDRVKQTASGLLAHNPFLENIPFLLPGVTLQQGAAHWLLADAQKGSLPLLNPEKDRYHLLAATGGQAFDAFVLYRQGGVHVQTLFAKHKMVVL
ncbi:MAG: SWIM zinc finger family protein [Bacteroidetes bacterium]|nr:MAG: SWIM zinc finger family protein [Bacteroidota bacterium]